MPTNVRSSCRSQIVAWAVASLFVLGFFFPLVGAVTGPILGVWLVGTQKLRRGFLWMVATTLLFTLPATLRSFSATVLAHGPGQTLNFVAAVLLAVLLSVLPFTFHRLISPRLQGFASTLPFPLATVALPALFLALHRGPATGNGHSAFLICWFAAIVVWMWNQEFRGTTVVFGAGLVLAVGLSLVPQFNGAMWSQSTGTIFGYMCLGAVLLLGAWAPFHAGKRQTWAERSATVALLQSPFSGNPLHVVTEDSREWLVSGDGERFPIRDGIPAFTGLDDLTGDNGKYNRLYDVIGGFYDDIQRVFCALKGFDRQAYFLSYMSLLEAKPGDRVLETSVGTGLNYKYLPRGVQLSGLDLSAEMLAACKANLKRWRMDADLFLGNAESLPFADSSFDVVFHVGGINFFNDRAKAIREMIRVAKPGSLLLIADETEKHVKEVYEKSLSGLYKDRKQPVSPPIDLVPPEMQEVHLEQMRYGDWYALTFRKPALPADQFPASASLATAEALSL